MSKIMSDFEAFVDNTPNSITKEQQTAYAMDFFDDFTREEAMNCIREGILTADQLSDLIYKRILKGTWKFQD